jgi:hypothetical protein
MHSRLVSFARRAAVFSAVVLSASAASGCYVYEPSTATLLSPGKSIALDLNDLGRLNLANLIGPEVKRIAGVLVSQTNNDYVIHVSQLVYFNGRTSEWSGEAVNVRGDYVSGVFEEKLSASRTALAVAGGVAGVGALVAARNLVANGTDNTDTKGNPGGTPVSSRGNQ